ncbi:MAG: glycosyl hydrolase family 95 catalytic domain-containing protein, partial [Eubacteriales bacterium]
KNENYHLHLTACAPYTQSLITIRAEAKKGDLPIKFALKPLADEPLADCLAETNGNLLKITKDYVREAEWETKSAAAGKVLGWKNTDGVLREGEEATLVVSVHTNHDEDDYISKAESDISGINEKQLEEYRASHLKWWEDFWNTSGISVPSEEKIEKFWYGSHYLMACCSKTGKFAPGLFGNWITTNQPNWNGDYHLNYNYEAPWWGVYSSNKVSLSDPYDKPLMDYIPQARINARERLANEGIYCKVGIGPMGLESSRMYNSDGTEAIDRPYWGQKSNSAYAAINMIMRFYSTWDKDYAEKYALPYLTEVADFWEDYFVFEDGRYVIYRDCIHESGSDPRDFNPILTLGLLRSVFRALIDISEYLGKCEERREKWNHILTHLSGFPVMERDGRTIFRLTERGYDWCDGNSLAVQHIFPSGAIGLSSDEELLKISRDTVTAMNRWSDYNAFATYYTAAVRVGYDPAVIIENLNRQIDTHSFNNFFIYYGGGGIECCSAVPTCVNEMLFQSHEGVLRFFPVWDKNKDASFDKLRGYGAFVVSAELKNGVIGDIEMFSEKGRPCSVLCPWESGMTVLANGTAISCETKTARDGVVYTFATEAGKSYILRAEK